MISITKQLPSNNTPSRTDTARSRMIRQSTTPTMASVLTHAHDNSLISLAYNFASGVTKRQENYQKFSASLLKNKSLLVPTRLAIKRQQAALQNPSLQYEPLRSETFQIELGNPTDIKSTSPDYNRIKSTSHYTSQLRGDTPHTALTDISLMYR
jgi:hypothetical protein